VPVSGKREGSRRNVSEIRRLREKGFHARTRKMIQKIKGERLQKANATDSDIGEGRVKPHYGLWLMGTILVMLPARDICKCHLLSHRVIIMYTGCPRKKVQYSGRS
jgi:hypothetical protein